ncbi:MAG: polysaccharide biosynthesis/export family protein [Candidatus Korobacteraceae bacterium]
MGKEFDMIKDKAKQGLRISAMLVLLAALAAAQASSSQVPSVPGRMESAVTPIPPATLAVGAPSVAAAAPTTEILIGGGDLLEVSVYGAPDYDKQVRVSAEGEITLPLAGMVKIGGMTTAQAEAVIAMKLSDGGYFRDPKVSVLEKEFSTQGISVLGEVAKPGIYPLPGSRNLFDAISAASGVTARAGSIVTITHRNDPEHQSTVILSNNGKSSGSANVPLFPGDTVMVSKAGIVYVTGSVNKPGGFVMENAHMTVLQAVAMAQGAISTAALDKAEVIRNSGQGSKPEEIPIQLKKILSAKAPDVNLQENDIVFVPNSAAKSAGKRTLEAIVQAATGAALVVH